MKTWVIYRHVCIENRKSYIGQTCQTNINQRWRDGKGYKPKKDTHTSVFWNAICAHGGIEAWDTAWEHIILEDGIDTLEKANERERYWIAYHHTWKYDPQCNGYNLTPGGDAVEGSRLVSKDDITLKVNPTDLDKYLADGWLLHDSIEYRPIKHRKWYAEHKAEQNARTKKYHEEHKAEQNEINRKNCAEYYKNPEYRARKRAYRVAHRAEENARARQYYQELKNDPEYKRKHAEANKRWAEKKNKRN